MENLKTAQTGINNKPKVVKSGNAVENVKLDSMFAIVLPAAGVHPVSLDAWLLLEELYRPSRQTRSYLVFENGGKFWSVHESKLPVNLWNSEDCEIELDHFNHFVATYHELGKISTLGTHAVILVSDSLDGLEELIRIHRLANHRSPHLKRIVECDGYIKMEFKNKSRVRQNGSHSN